MGAWEDILSGGQSALNSIGGTENLLPLLALYMVGQYQNNQDKKNQVTASDAMGQLQTTSNNYANLFNQAQAGVTTNPMLQEARTNTQSLVNSGVNPPTLNSARTAMNNIGSDPNMLSAAQNAAMNGGTGAQQNQTLGNVLTNQLANRFGTRSQSTGTLTPNQSIINMLKNMSSTGNNTNNATTGNTGVTGNQFLNNYNNSVYGKGLSNTDFNNFTETAAIADQLTTPQVQGLVQQGKMSSQMGNYWLNYLKSKGR